MGILNLQAQIKGKRGKRKIAPRSEMGSESKLQFEFRRVKIVFF